MNQPLKNIEVAFRRFLLRSLKYFSRSRQDPPKGVDYNKCKFLFIRQDRIGDVLVSTPLFLTLKNSYPDAAIDVLLSRNNHFVLDHAPYIRNRWVYTKKLWASFLLLRSIRRERYDFVVDLMDNPSATSTVFVLLANGRWNVGLEKDNSYAYDICVPMLSRKETHIVDRLGAMLSVFGVPMESVKLRVDYSTSPDSDRFAEITLQNQFKQTAGYIGINISAGNDSRFWGISQYQAFLVMLRGNYDSYSIILLHKPEDRARAMEIAGPFPQVLVPFDLSFDQFAAFIKRLSVLVTPDTSAVHLAAAFGVPSVILYVQSDKSLRIWEPYRTECETIVAEGELSTITASSVFQAFQRLMARLPLLHQAQHSGITERV